MSQSCGGSSVFCTLGGADSIQGSGRLRIRRLHCYVLTMARWTGSKNLNISSVRPMGAQCNLYTRQTRLSDRTRARRKRQCSWP